MYTWGVNEYGQCGNGGTTYVESPSRVSILMQKLVSVSAGDRFTVVLSDRSATFSCGRNSEGQLGLGYIKNGTWRKEERPIVATPKECKELTVILRGNESNIEKEGGFIENRCGRQLSSDPFIKPRALRVVRRHDLNVVDSAPTAVCTYVGPTPPSHLLPLPHNATPPARY